MLEPFDRFIGMSEDAGLFVRPYTLSVMITPLGHHGRFLMYATPRAGGIHLAAGPDAFAGCALVESSRERRHRHHPDGVRHRTDPGVRRPRTLDNSPVPM